MCDTNISNAHRLITPAQRRGFYTAAPYLTAAIIMTMAQPLAAQTVEEFEVSGGTTAHKDDSIWFCGLSGVKGNFSEVSADQFVHIHSQSDEFWLHAGAGQTGRMICIKWTNFIRPPGGGTLFSTLLGDSFTVDPGGDVSLWFGDAASLIQSMEGEFESGQEKLLIEQNTNPSAASKLKIRTDGSTFFEYTFIEAYAQSLFVGNSNDHRLVKLIGYNTSGVRARGNVTTAGTFEMPVATDSGFSGYWLAPVSGTNSAFCYFTRLAGDFNGNGESAKITNVNGMWHLSVTAGGTGLARASARCMAYDQR